MSSTYAGNNVFPGQITEPSDGEPGTVASVNVPLEGLADRTVYLKTILDGENGRTLRNLRPQVIASVVPTAFNFNAHKRGDGSNTSFWSDMFHFWIKCGVDTAGIVYIGDNDLWFLHDTGASGAVKTSFGCDSTIGASVGRVTLYNGDLKTTGGGVDPKYLRGPASGDITGAWTTLSLDTIAGFLTYVRAGDVVVTPTQRVIVCGGGDISGTGQFLIWKSDDDGATFTRVTVANLTVSQSYLARIIVGKNGRLVTWVKATSANQGAILYYSDDDGDTWSSRSAIGFDQIIDGVYLPDLDLWFFANATSVQITDDPVIGSFTPYVPSFTVNSMGGFASYLVLAVSTASSLGSGWNEIHISTDGLASAELVARLVFPAATLHIASNPDRGQITCTGIGATHSSLMQSLRY